MKYLVVSLALVVTTPVLTNPTNPPPDKEKHATIELRATPSIAFSPARVVVTADLLGGGEDASELYCPSIEWVWGDGTRSDEASDCDPYQPGKSEIQRHFAADRVFETSGDYRVQFRLRQKDKVVAAGSTLVKIRPGVREGGGGF
jgi:hypothetical protein